MQASEVLKMKLQSERLLALYAQQGVASTWKAMKGIGSNIYAGVERVSWYSSCLVPDYHEVCRELISEEKRMLCSVRSLYRYRDVIGHMLYLYFQKVIEDIDNGNRNDMARSVNLTVAENVARIPAGKATRLSMAVALSNALSMSGAVSRSVIERLAARVPNVVWLFQVFGTDQKCALAARRLKNIDEKYYAILYSAELEMLYYFIEPVLSEVIQNVQMACYRNFDEVYHAIKSKYHV